MSFMYVFTHMPKLLFFTPRQSLEEFFLIKYFFNGNLRLRNILFLFSILLPSSVIYYIPYTESLFLFTMTLAMIGLLKGRYSLYFIGIFLLSSTRPAAVFVFLAIGLIDLVRLLSGLKFKVFVKEIFLKLLPFIIGFGSVIFIQYLYTHSWTYLFQAQSYWEGKIQIPKSITDWSIEGFGLNVFSLFVICIPSFVYMLIKFFKIPLVLKNDSIIKASSTEIINEYLVLLSATYFSGIFLFTSIYSGGNLHSLFRFILTTPMFYIAVIIFFNKTANFSKFLKLGVTTIPIIILAIFLFIVEYAGGRFNYHFIGMFLFIFLYVFYIYHDELKPWLQLSLLIVLGFFSIIWTTFLFNIFLSDGWIFA